MMVLVGKEHQMYFSSSGGSSNYACGIGTVDGALFAEMVVLLKVEILQVSTDIFQMSGVTTFQEDWDGIGWYRGPDDAGTHVQRNGTSGKVGSVNSHGCI